MILGFFIVFEDIFAYLVLCLTEIKQKAFWYKVEEAVIQQRDLGFSKRGEECLQFCTFLVPFIDKMLGAHLIQCLAPAI